MKVVVLIPFCDKYTGEQYKKGDVFNITAKRFNEITQKGRYIQLVEEEESTNEQA